MSVTKYREILRLASQGDPPCDIAVAAGCHRNTVTRVIERARKAGIEWPLPDDLSDIQLRRILYPKTTSERKNLRKVDYEWVHRELKRKGVTRSLLYEEYCDVCRATNTSPCSISKFNQDYEKWAANQNVVMHIRRRPAEKLELDWAGTKMNVCDRVTGELSDVFIFVACLPFSGKLYAEGFFGMDSQCWQTAHVHAFDYYGGTPKELVPDNCKTAVIKHTKQELLINKDYESLARHYGCTIAPARVRHPRDKANVEAGVGIITRRAIAALRDRTFFTLGELNAALLLKVEEINNAAFAKKPGSRNQIFDDQEKECLSPLPTDPYPVCTWERATVNPNYHMKVLNAFYSVPFEYTGRVCDARATLHTVEIFFEDMRIATHVRSYTEHDFVTNEAHCPENHRSYLEWNTEGLISQAKRIGPSTEKAMSLVLGAEPTKHRSLGQGKRLISFSSRYGSEILEQACKKCLDTTSHNVVSTDSIECLCEAAYKTLGDIEDSGKYALLRGKQYYSDKLADKKKD